MKSQIFTKIIFYLFPFLFELITCSNFANNEGITFKLNKIQGQFKNKIKYKIRNLGNGNDFSKIYGNSSSLNYYYVNIYIGTPPKKQAVIIDTGSHLTSVPCQPLCESCGKHLNSYFTLSSNYIYIF